MRLLVGALEAGLPGDRYERRAVEVGVRHARQQVGRARPQGSQTHAGVGREASVDVRHERRALLVTREDEADLVAVGECGIQRERLLAGDAEDVPHALVLQTLHE